MTGGKTVSRVFLLLLFSKLRNILMDIKILHIDSNNPILMRQLQELGFENHEDFTSSKEQIEAKIESYHGIVIRSRFKIDKTFRQRVIYSL
jgi:D-3-phosphoglycerate dehydrogenase